LCTHYELGESPHREDERFDDLLRRGARPESGRERRQAVFERLFPPPPERDDTQEGEAGDAEEE
jgi:hypothetical protein